MRGGVWGGSRERGTELLGRSRRAHPAAPSLQMTEMEISRAAAERSLREHLGNVVEALITLTN